MLKPPYKGCCQACNPYGGRDQLTDAKRSGFSDKDLKWNPWISICFRIDEIPMGHHISQ